MLDRGGDGFAAAEFAAPPPTPRAEAACRGEAKAPGLLRVRTVARGADASSRLMTSGTRASAVTTATASANPTAETTIASAPMSISAAPGVCPSVDVAEGGDIVALSLSTVATAVATDAAPEDENRPPALQRWHATKGIRQPAPAAAVACPSAVATIAAPPPHPPPAGRAAPASSDPPLASAPLVRRRTPLARVDAGSASAVNGAAGGGSLCESGKCDPPHAGNATGDARGGSRQPLLPTPAACVGDENRPPPPPPCASDPFVANGNRFRAKRPLVARRAPKKMLAATAGHGDVLPTMRV